RATGVLFVPLSRQEAFIPAMKKAAALPRQPLEERDVLCLLRAVDRLRRRALCQKLRDLFTKLFRLPAAADVVFRTVIPAERQTDRAADQLEDLAGAVLRLFAHQPGNQRRGVLWREDVK